MTAIGEALKSYIVSSTAVNAVVSGRVHENVIPEVSSRPNIWFGRSSQEQVTCFDGGAGLFKSRFALECIAVTADVAIDLADLVRSRLHASSSTTAGVNIRGMLVEDQDDDYMPKGIGGDVGLHVSALEVLVMYEN